MLLINTTIFLVMILFHFKIFFTVCGQRRTLLETIVKLKKPNTELTTKGVVSNHALLVSVAVLTLQSISIAYTILETQAVLITAAQAILLSALGLLPHLAMVTDLREPHYKPKSKWFGPHLLVIDIAALIIPLIVPVSTLLAAIRTL